MFVHVQKLHNRNLFLHVKKYFDNKPSDNMMFNTKNSKYFIHEMLIKNIDKNLVCLGDTQ